MNKVSIAKNHERWAAMDRILVCTLMLLILFPGMVLAQKEVGPLSPDYGLATIAEYGANINRSDMPRVRAISHSQDNYLNLLLTPDDAVKSPSPELIADASDGDSNTDADGNDNTDSDDDQTVMMIRTRVIVHLLQPNGKPSHLSDNGFFRILVCLRLSVCDCLSKRA